MRTHEIMIVPTNKGIHVSREVPRSYEFVMNREKSILNVSY